MWIISVVPLAIVIVIGVLVNKARKEQKQREEDRRRGAALSQRMASSSSTGGKTVMTDEQRRRLEYLKSQQAQKRDVSAEEKHERHQGDAHEHGHTGEEEHYEEIVGSLGDVNDEGCEDLSGVRFIAHDLAYDTRDEVEHDYTELAKAMVLGEIINTPRFKSPYTRRK